MIVLERMGDCDLRMMEIVLWLDDGLYTSKLYASAAPYSF